MLCRLLACCLELRNALFVCLFVCVCVLQASIPGGLDAAAWVGVLPLENI